MCDLRLHVGLVCNVLRMHIGLLCILWMLVGLVCAWRMIVSFEDVCWIKLFTLKMCDGLVFVVQVGCCSMDTCWTCMCSEDIFWTFVRVEDNCWTFVCFEDANLLNFCVH
jgi:hypothetical protein